MRGDVPTGEREDAVAPSDVARQRFAGKRVAVVGLAREGLSLVRFLARAGALVTANDRSVDLPRASQEVLEELAVPAVLGGHPADLFLESDVVFVSPGVPQGLDPLVRAREAGVAFSSETQLFFELCRGRIVGITGSSGKTTTTALTGEMFRRAGLPVHVGGNIGKPLIESVDEIAPDDWVVLEMSSFQLETLPYSPPLAAILNITPNHLDRHAGMDAYAAAKQNMVRYQGKGDKAVLNADDARCRSIPTANPPIWFSIEREVDGSYLREGFVVVSSEGGTAEVCPAGEVQLRGRHNLANVVAAVAVASGAGLAVEPMRAAIRDFTGVPHRLEMVAQIGGVEYCNDSIATSPERAIASLHAFESPVVLIAGGRNKKLPMAEWGKLIRERVRALILMGEATEEIERAVVDAPGGVLPPIRRAGSMGEAVALAAGMAVPGDVVLLAPGCTSFDMFKDFEERGELFRDAVGLLAEHGMGVES
ncbi:MAG TPA: UDP-N-acetylmuramoyl-L-alanine--D-glutamate ligase [Chloroflexota bacterium]